MHRFTPIVFVCCGIAGAPRLGAQGVPVVGATPSVSATTRPTNASAIALRVPAGPVGVPLQISKLLQRDSRLPDTPAAVDARPTCAMPVAPPPANARYEGRATSPDMARMERMPVTPSRCRNPLFQR